MLLIMKTCIIMSLCNFYVKCGAKFIMKVPSV